MNAASGSVDIIDKYSIYQVDSVGISARNSETDFSIEQYGVGHFGAQSSVRQAPMEYSHDILGRHFCRNLMTRGSGGAGSVFLPLQVIL